LMTRWILDLEKGSFLASLEKKEKHDQGKERVTGKPHRSEYYYCPVLMRAFSHYTSSAKCRYVESVSTGRSLHRTAVPPFYGPVL
jgi:hypothetical protein